MASSPHHSSFYQGTKRISPLKIRNPSILPSQIMPSPSGVPFNVADMPWCYGSKPGQVMEFNAVIRPSPIAVPSLQGPHTTVPTVPAPSTSGTQHFASYPMFSDIRKRKPDPDVIPVPSKQFLTEEAMSSHLNNLHLSSEYTTHNIETTSGCGAVQDDDMSLDVSCKPYHVHMSPQELEERLKKAQRIAVCEEVRNMDNRAEILPKALLERIEKPCTALMLWQPPQALSTLVEKKQDGAQGEGEGDSRQTDATMMEDLPDLPDSDDDLGFGSGEEDNNNVSSVADLNTMDVEM